MQSYCDGCSGERFTLVAIDADYESVPNLLTVHFLSPCMVALFFADVYRLCILISN